MPTDYRFSISRIDLLEKSINWSLYKANQPYSFDVRIEINLDEEEKFARHTIMIDIHQDDDAQILASLQLACIFAIPDMAKHREVTPDGTPLPEELILLLNTVTIGTARGVLFSEFRGTFLNDATLPVMDPTAFQPVAIEK